MWGATGLREPNTRPKGFNPRTRVGCDGIPVRGAAGGWKDQSSGQHTRLAYVSGGGIILELFFISNPEELSIYQSKKWLVARELADVIAEHFGLPCAA